MCTSRGTVRASSSGQLSVLRSATLAMVATNLVVHLECFGDPLLDQQVVNNVVPADDTLHRVTRHAHQLQHLGRLVLPELAFDKRRELQRVSQMSQFRQPVVPVSLRHGRVPPAHPLQVGCVVYIFRRLLVQRRIDFLPLVCSDCRQLPRLLAPPRNLLYLGLVSRRPSSLAHDLLSGALQPPLLAAHKHRSDVTAESGARGRIEGVCTSPETGAAVQHGGGCGVASGELPVRLGRRPKKFQASSEPSRASARDVPKHHAKDIWQPEVHTGPWPGRPPPDALSCSSRRDPLL
jgi:hypothetical protein